MPRRSSRRRLEEEEEEEEESSDVDMEEEDLSSQKQSKRSSSLIVDSEDEEEEEAGGEEEGDDEIVMFSSQAPEMTQDIVEVKEYERNNLMGMSESQREKAISDLARLVLFKALAGDSIDRSKACKEAGISDARISSAAFDEVKIRLKNCFDFELKRMPAWMENMKGLSKTMKDRYYVVNAAELQPESHSKLLHSVHDQSAVEKGLLMVVLGFVYCKGQPRNDGSRWINDKHLYDLLHRLDENMPPEPPTSSKRGGKSTAVRHARAALTPDVDTLLHKFVHRDYLLKEKASADAAQAADVEEDSHFYSMGPRAVIEIGRRQVIYFCSEVLEEEVPKTMLVELEQNEGEEEEAVAME